MSIKYVLWRSISIPIAVKLYSSSQMNVTWTMYEYQILWLLWRFNYVLLSCRVWLRWNILAVGRIHHHHHHQMKSNSVEKRRKKISYPQGVYTPPRESFLFIKDSKVLGSKLRWDFCGSTWKISNWKLIREKIHQSWN